MQPRTVLFVSLLVCWVNTGFAQQPIQQEPPVQRELPVQLEIVVQTGHTYPISNIDVTHDGKYFLTNSMAGRSFLWETNSGRKLRSFDNTGIATLSGDGKLLATGHTDIVLWDVTSGRKLRTIALDEVPAGSDNYVHSLALSHDGSLLAVADSFSKRITTWDTSTGNKRRSFGSKREDYQNAPAVKLSRNGNLILSSNQFGPTHVWSADSGGQLANLGEKSNETVSGVSDDGNLALTFDPNRSVATLWNITSGQQQQSFTGQHGQPTCTALSGDGSITAMGFGDGSISLWETQDGQQLHRLSGFKDLAANPKVTSLGLSTNGKLLVAGNAYGLVSVWDTTGGNKLQHIPRNSGCIPVALSSDGNRLSAMTNDYIKPSYKGVDIPHDAVSMAWDLPTGKRPSVFDTSAGTTGHWRQTNARQVILFGPVEASLWDVSTGTKLHSFDQESIDRTECMTIHADEMQLVTGGLGATLWDVESGRKLRTFDGQSRLITAVSLSSDKRFLATGSIDRSVCLWEISSGQKLREFQGNQLDIASLDLNYQKDRLAAASHSGTVIVWNASQGQIIREFLLPNGSGASAPFVAMDRNARFLLTHGSPRIPRSTGLTNHATIWDLNSGEPLQHLEGSPAAISHDGKFVWTRSLDGARLWDVKSGSELCRLFTVNHGQDWLVVTPEGFFDGSQEASQHVVFRTADSLNVHADDSVLNRFRRPGLLGKIWQTPR